MDRIVATGVPWAHVKCLQRFRSGQVDFTFTLSDSRDLFLSTAGITIQQRTARTRPAWQTGTFVIVWDAPWELPDDLISQRLQEYGKVHSNQRAYNQSLFPQKVYDGCLVLRMSIARSIPPFIKIGPFFSKNILHGSTPSLLEVRVPRTYREGVPCTILFQLCLVRTQSIRLRWAH